MYSVTTEYSQNIAKAVRSTAISGFIKTKSGAIYQFTDDNIKSGSLSISSKLNSYGDFRPGGVYASELSIGLIGFGDESKNLDGAKITLKFNLYRNDGTEDCDSVPLGTFYIDGSTIKRKFDVVTFKADDAMLNFDYPAEAIEGTLFDLALAACMKCDIAIRMSSTEFAELPNADLTVTVDTSRIQTWRDLLMYIGMATNSFARIERTGGLRFVPLTCTKNEGNVIIPVREIMGNVRYSTDFSDDTTRITKLITRRNGAQIASTNKYTPGGSEQFATLELMENPLLAALSDDEIMTALNNEVQVLVKCLNRAYNADFNGDPALEVGDYVRLRGGAVDTARGYATGMITSQIWRYRGQHSIKCVMPTSVAPAEADEETAAVAAVSVLSDEETPQPERIQPKSQIEKRVDALEAKAAGKTATTAEKLQSTATSAIVETFHTGVKMSDENGTELAKFSSAIIINTFTQETTKMLWLKIAYLDIGEVELREDGIFFEIGGVSGSIYSNTMAVGNSCFYFKAAISSGNVAVTIHNYSDSATHTLVFKDDGLYYDNRRLAFADEIGG